MCLHLLLERGDSPEDTQQDRWADFPPLFGYQVHGPFTDPQRTQLSEEPDSGDGGYTADMEADVGYGLSCYSDHLPLH